MNQLQYTRQARTSRPIRHLCKAALLGLMLLSGYGTAERVEIRRDTYGVPHIYANTTYGLFYGYGYAVGQDRLFQMEMAKRTFTGRVAEVLGKEHVATDVATRRNFIEPRVRAQLERLPQNDRDVLRGYAAGLNAVITQVVSDRTQLPKQFTDYGFSPEPWNEYDIAMIFLGTMAFRYGDFNNEINNLALLRDLQVKHGNRAQAIFDSLFWVNDTQAPTTTHGAVNEPSLPEDSDVVSFLRGSPKPEPVAVNRGPFDNYIFSNLMLVGRSRTAGANAMMLNGPQFGNFNPSYVYAVGLHGAGYDVVGNTPFAYPVILFGHNGRVAWGATSGPNDVVDIYEETLDPQDPARYLYNGEYRQMETFKAVVKVKDADPVPVDISTTAHGIVVQSDPQRGVAYSKRRSWDGDEVSSMMAWVKSMRAQNYAQWTDQASNYALPINWYYADVRGNIGYVSNGKLPVRPSNQPRVLPASGKGDMEWQGFRSFSENPQTYNPTQGVIVNWNNKPSPDFVNNDFANFSFADRVNELLAALNKPGPLSTNDLKEANRYASFVDPNARYFVGPLVGAVRGQSDAGLTQAAALVQDWWSNGAQRRDENNDGKVDHPGAVIFRTWLGTLLRDALGDELGNFESPLTRGYGAVSLTRPASGVQLLAIALNRDATGVTPTHDFFDGADPNAAMVKALSATLQQLRTAQGNDLTAWRDVQDPHIFSARNFVGIPQANLNEELKLPVAMNRGTENNLSVLFSHGVRSMDVTPPGQSGFIAPNGQPSVHYQDQMNLYRDFQLKPQLFSRMEVEAGTTLTEVLDVRR